MLRRSIGVTSAIEGARRQREPVQHGRVGAATDDDGQFTRRAKPTFSPSASVSTATTGTPHSRSSRQSRGPTWPSPTTTTWSRRGTARRPIRPVSRESTSRLIRPPVKHAARQQRQQHRADDRDLEPLRAVVDRRVRPDRRQRLGRAVERVRGGLVEHDHRADGLEDQHRHEPERAVEQQRRAAVVGREHRLDQAAERRARGAEAVRPRATSASSPTNRSPAARSATEVSVETRRRPAWARRCRPPR